MANVNEVILTAQWAAGSKNEPDMANLPAGCSWEDITGQPAANLPCTPNVYLVRAFLTDAAYTTVNADTRFIVLARRVFDSAIPGVYTSENYSEKPTAAQLTTLKNLVITRYPGVNDDALTEAGAAIFRAGLTRAEAIALLVARWRRFLKAI